MRWGGGGEAHWSGVNRLGVGAQVSDPRHGGDTLCGTSPMPQNHARSCSCRTPQAIIDNSGAPRTLRPSVALHRPTHLAWAGAATSTTAAAAATAAVGALNALAVTFRVLEAL